MILTGNEIRDSLEQDIFIEPYNEEQLNSNSYNLRLDEKLLVYDEVILDPKRENRTSELLIPPEGYVLEPHRLYLGCTIEKTETHNLVPMLEGRSSWARLGLGIHISAGFGDIGFIGHWTLEMQCIHPVKIYAGMEIAQIFYHVVCGRITEYESNKYQNNSGIQPCMLHKELT